MLDLGALINVMPASIYRALNFGDLEPTGMTIQLANKRIIQPLGVLEDVLVQVNELIFPTDFYVLDMEDETSGKESTLILGRPFLMTARTQIDVHVGTVSMEFGDTLVQFNIFEATKHPTEDHSLFGIDVIEELVKEYFQLNSCSEDIEDFAGSTNLINCIGPITEEADYKEVQDLPNFEDNHSDIADLEPSMQPGEPKCTNNAELEVVETKNPFSAQLATIFMVGIKSARGRQEEKNTKVNSVEESNDKADTLAKMKLANEDQKQTGVEAPFHPYPTPKLHEKPMPTRSRQELNPPSGVGQSSQRSKSCRHTWCQVQINAWNHMRILGSIMLGKFREVESDQNPLKARKGKNKSECKEEKEKK
ncbi:hypothetical protein CR513_58245, partial [Mucuna pruriens]